MSEFEKVYASLVDRKDEARIERIDAHQQSFELTPHQAIMYDDAMFIMLKATLTALGATIDTIDDPVVKAAAIASFSGILVSNMEAVRFFIYTVGMGAAVTGQAIGCDNPGCDCSNCTAARAIQEALLEADRVHASQN